MVLANPTYMLTAYDHMYGISLLEVPFIYRICVGMYSLANPTYVQ